MNAEKRLVAEALLSYADSCTMPLLTPSCPYYRAGPDGADCGEECRDVVNRHGGVARPERSASVGALIMHGRELPIQVAGGTKDFDSAKSYLEDREKETRSQSTASLLLSLSAIVLEHAITGYATRLSHALAVWGELDRRIAALDEVFVGGLADRIASAVIVRVALEFLQSKGRLDLEDIVGQSPASPDNSWLAAAEASRTSRGGIDGRRRDSASPDFEMLGAALPHLFESKQEIDAFVAEPTIAHVLSPTFRRRVTRWFANLLPIDLAGTLSVRIPRPELFAALEPFDARDPGGRWIWERFTITQEENWATSSLSLEWDWAERSMSTLCDGRVLAERVADQAKVGRIVMERSLASHKRAPRWNRGFDPTEYTTRASQLLVNGDWPQATRIFEGLVDLAPGDATAWNNLGFCQLPEDPSQALVSLRRSEALSRNHSLLCSANQVLALHLIGNDEEAEKHGREVLAIRGVIHDSESWVWDHPTSITDSDMELTDVPDVRQYLQQLLLHISASECSVDDVRVT